MGNISIIKSCHVTFFCLEDGREIRKDLNCAYTAGGGALSGSKFSFAILQFDFVITLLCFLIIQFGLLVTAPKFVIDGFKYGRDFIITNCNVSFTLSLPYNQLPLLNSVTT